MQKLLAYMSDVFTVCNRVFMCTEHHYYDSGSSVKGGVPDACVFFSWLHMRVPQLALQPNTAVIFHNGLGEWLMKHFSHWSLMINTILFALQV
jgi:hypothetical protein